MSAASRTVETNESKDRMGVTVPDAVRGVHPCSHLAPSVRSKLEAVACALGCSEAVAEKKLWGPHAVNVETARILEVLISRGETDHAGIFAAPIDAALQGSATLVADILLASAEADCREDSFEARYWAHPCPATALAWIQASAVERTRGEQREKFLRERWGIEK